MDISLLAERYSAGTAERCKAIFSTIFIVGNRLQALFDRHIPGLTLRQFMLLSIARQSPEPLTLTELGALLGCSRQNVKKLALALERGGFARLRRPESGAYGEGGGLFRQRIPALRLGAGRALLRVRRG